VAITNCSLVTHGGNAYNGGKAAMNYCVMDAEGRAASSVATGYSGDHNVFFSFSGNTDDPFIHYNGSLYSYKSLAGFQTASGTNANSVYTKYADQTSGNTYAFWLGTKNGTGGPEVGDFRINPTCRVFDSAGTARTGTFTDGVSVTLAGPQTHWDYNTRASVAGPPTARPTLPTTIAQMRTLVNAPAAWVY
jgi:hypothetical protein